MISEQPVINFLDALAWDLNTGSWRPIAGQATRVDIARGGSRNEVSNTMKPGTLEIELKGDIDLAYDGALRPNSPIRIVMRDGVAGEAGVWKLPVPYVNTPTITSDLETSFINPASSAMGASGGRWRILRSWTGGSSAVSDVPSGTTAVRVSGYQTPIGGRRYRVTVWARDLGTFKMPLRLEVWQGGDVALVSTPPVTLSAAYAPISLVYTAPRDNPFTQQILLRTTAQNTIEMSSAGSWGVQIDRVEVDLLPIEPTPLFTGTIGDLNQDRTIEKGKVATFTTVFASDGIATVANTPRHGAVNEGGSGYETWEDRIRRLNRTSPVPTSEPRRDAAVLYSWDGTAIGWSAAPGSNAGRTVGLSVSNGELVYSLVRTGGSSESTPAGAVNVSHTISGLVPGVQYRAVAAARLLESVGITDGTSWRARLYDGNGTIASTPATTLTGAGKVLTLPFTARAASAILVFETTAAISSGASGTRRLRVAFDDMQVLSSTAADDRYLLTDLVYESTLANHYDLACDSVGARWWADRWGVLQFRRSLEQATPEAIFTDLPGGQSLHYRNTALNFDTRGVVTQLTLSQHGRKVDPTAPGNYIADDAEYAYESPSDVRSWGARAASVDVGIWTGDSAHARDREQRAREIFADRGMPRMCATGLVWNAQENTAAAAALDIYTPVRVEYGGTKQVARIVSMKHKITPTRWMVTLAFTDIRPGDTFAESNSARGSRTFAQGNVIRGTKTFAQLNREGR